MASFGTGGYDEMEGAEESHNVSFLLTLLTMLDFQSPGQVGKEDWERGIAALHAPGLSWEVSWHMLLRRFDLDNNGSIDFGEMHGLAPLDPRLASLLRVVVQTLVRLSERINGVHAGLNEAKMKMLKGTINQWKDKCTSTAFKAWRDDVRKVRQQRETVLANFRYAPCRKCLHAMHRMLSERKAAMARAANMMYSAETRLKQQVMDAWRDAHFADRDAKNRKLMLFFVGREEWWKNHVVETWKKVTRNERGLRRFLMKWMFQGLAKTFTAWARYVRRTADERNRGLAKGIAMLSGGVRYKCFLAWANEARTQREERDAILRSKLLKNGAMLSAKMARAWFDYSARRRAAKRRICFGASHAGAAFRTWLQLIDAKRRKEFLEWALGPDMSVLGGKLKAATKVLAEQTSEQFDSIRDQFNSFKDQWKDQVLVERKATQEKLDRKVDLQEVAEHARAIDEARDELEAIREQIAAQAETQKSLSLDSERAATDLSEQMNSLTRDMEARVSQTHRALDRRAGEEEKALNVVTEELNVIKNTKANHEELLQLVKKLQHRPRPGAPIGVQSLLAVPYPMPPGQTRTAGNQGPRASRSRPGSAARVGGGGGAGGAPPPQQQQFSAFGSTLPPGGVVGNAPGQAASMAEVVGNAEMREVATEVVGEGGQPYPPFVATSEQILMRPVPADADYYPPHPNAAQDAALGITRAGSAGGRLRTQTLVPPSSHTAALSARASPTVNAIVQNRRPASARAPTSQVAMFASRTERLERSLGIGASAAGGGGGGAEGEAPAAAGRRPGLV